MMAAAIMHEQGRLFPTAEQVYEDEDGRQRNVENDRQLEKFRPQIDEMANQLDDRQAKSLGAYLGHGGESDEKSISQFLSEADKITKDLPKSKQEGGNISFYNWRGLLLDEVYRTHRRKGFRGI